MYNLGNLGNGIDDNRGKSEPDFPLMNPTQHACSLAEQNTSYLEYLKRLDKHTSVKFPFHCRTIDFYLACKESKEAKEDKDAYGSEESNEAKESEESNESKEEEDVGNIDPNLANVQDAREEVNDSNSR